jgi:hypothetical protein
MMGLIIYFFHINVPFHVGLDHYSLLKFQIIRALRFSRIIIQIEKKMTQPEKRFNTFHSNWAKKSKIVFKIYLKVYFLTIFAYICV